jgi:hypothetical protein
MTEDEVCYLVAWGAFALGALCINGALLWGACMAVQALIAGEPGAVAGLAMIGGVSKTRSRGCSRGSSRSSSA